MNRRGEFLDVSLPLHEQLPLWPGSPGLEVETLATIGAGSAARVTRIHLEVHTGTHVDAPSHFLSGGTTVERLPLDVLIGPALVAQAPSGAIGRSELAALDLPTGVERLLLRTPNSDLWRRGETRFVDDYAALSLQGARWLVEHGIRLFGIDYLSVQRFGDDPETHRVLLGAGVILLEGLDLSEVEAGEYELICLPIPLVGIEAAPARAVLRRR